MKNNASFTDEELLAAYAKTPTMSLLAVHFGVPKITMYRRCKKLNLSFSHNAYAKFELADILAGKHPQYGTVKLKKKLIKAGVKKNQCESCGVTDVWNDKPLVMQLDHINGDSHDHRLENLRMLCPNCHSQTETYSGRNKSRDGGVTGRDRTDDNEDHNLGLYH